MNRSDVLDLKETILEDNDKDAESLRKELKSQGIFYMNVMSSPGSGKTTTILRTLKGIGDEYRAAVMEADIDSSVDADKILDAGYPAVQLHTGGMCHLDADMSRQGMAHLEKAMGEKPEVVILENVGNLVCPSEFDTGAEMNVVILSVPEGDDKPLKYPLMFKRCSVVLVNKTDAAPAFDFDMDKLAENVHMRNPEAVIFPISALNGDGIDEWCAYLKERIGDFFKRGMD